MALNLTAIQDRLKKLQGGDKPTKTDSQIWKPGAGETDIRIVTLAKTPDYPFIEAAFHYGDKGNKLSLSTFNELDPFVEKCEEICNQGNQIQSKGKKLIDAGEKRKGEEMVAEGKAVWLFGIKNFQPTDRYYCVIIVRGQESQGPKLWAFGPQIYEKLLKVIADADYGDITNVNIGFDLKLTYTPPKSKQKDYKDYTGEFSAKTYGEMDIIPRRKESKLLVSTNEKEQSVINTVFDIMVNTDLGLAEKKTKLVTEFENLSSINEELSNTLSNILFKQPDVFTIFPKPTYSELELDLQKYMKKLDVEDVKETTSTEDKKESGDDKKEVADDKKEEKKEEKTAPPTDAVKNKFADLFGD